MPLIGTVIGGDGDCDFVCQPEIMQMLEINIVGGAGGNGGGLSRPMGTSTAIRGAARNDQRRGPALPYKTPE
jgi:hypothetical protein